MNVNELDALALFLGIIVVLAVALTFGLRQIIHNSGGLQVIQATTLLTVHW